MIDVCARWAGAAGVGRRGDAPPPAPRRRRSFAQLRRAAVAVDPGNLITSPFVGTFYRAPAPDAAPFAEVGQRVEKGQTLCIVEAMKLMNEIEADVSGTVKSIFVENAQPVEFGQKLFSIQAD